MVRARSDLDVWAGALPRRGTLGVWLAAAGLALVIVAGVGATWPGSGGDRPAPPRPAVVVTSPTPPATTTPPVTTPPVPGPPPATKPPGPPATTLPPPAAGLPGPPPTAPTTAPVPRPPPAVVPPGPPPATRAPRNKARGLDSADSLSVCLVEANKNLLRKPCR